MIRRGGDRDVTLHMNRRRCLNSMAILDGIVSVAYFGSVKVGWAFGSSRAFAVGFSSVSCSVSNSMVSSILPCMKNIYRQS